jgi:hypothetical protein
VLNTKRRCPIAKRFIDTDIFKKQFIRELDPSYKLLWIYILQDCNHAGIWEVDFEVAQIKTGCKFSKKVAAQKFSGKILDIDGGSKWFIPDFISFQYGQLSETNRAHIGVIQLLKKYFLLNDDLSINDLNKGHRSPLQAPMQGAKDMDKEMEQEKEMDKEKEKVRILPKKSDLVLPFNSENFLSVWNILLHEKKWRGKSANALQAALKKLSHYPEPEAIEMMNATIAGEWQGIFELKENEKNKIQNGTGTKRHSWSGELDELKRKFIRQPE